MATTCGETHILQGYMRNVVKETSRYKKKYRSIIYYSFCATFLLDVNPIFLTRVLHEWFPTTRSPFFSFA